MRSEIPLLPRTYIFVQGCPDGSLAGVEFLHHILYSLTEADFVEVDREDVLAGIELPQAAEILVRLSELERSDYGLEFGKEARTDGPHRQDP